jgi:Predicted oxidoreductases of the aldo/keto reductase family
MEKRKYLDKDVSLLGYGLMRLPRASDTSFDIDYAAAEKLIDHAMANGINYFDMAYTYAGSESFAGQVLSKYPRDSYYLATKCPPWKLKTADDFERIFNEQLKSCKTDYFDFYLVHNFAQEMKRADGNDEYFKHFEEIGMYEMLQRKKAEGKVRYIGFSFHGTPALLENIVDKYAWDFAQLQINYIDWAATDAKSQYEILTAHNIPVTIMEPLRGGALAMLSDEAAKALKEARPEDSLASWGIRYAASFPNVLTVLSGMNEIEQLDDNIATMTGFEPLTEQETALLYEAAAIYNRSGSIACTGCSYCLPCPAGVNIPRIFSIYNHYKLVKFRIPFDNGYSSLDKKEKASSCIQCGLCAQKCPQHLLIPDYMKEIAEFAGTPG